MTTKRMAMKIDALMTIKYSDDRKGVQPLLFSFLRESIWHGREGGALHEFHLGLGGGLSDRGVFGQHMSQQSTHLKSFEVRRSSPLTLRTFLS